MEGWKHGWTLFYRTLRANARGPITTYLYLSAQNTVLVLPHFQIYEKLIFFLLSQTFSLVPWRFEIADINCVRVSLYLLSCSFKFIGTLIFAFFLTGTSMFATTFKLGRQDPMVTHWKINLKHIKKYLCLSVQCS